MVPGAQAYTKVLNELVDMINTGTFPPDAKKKKQKRGKKKGNEETVGAITEADEGSSPTNTLPTEFEWTDSQDSESEYSNSLDASISSTGEESYTSSDSEVASEAPNAQSTMEHVLALI